MNKRPFEIALDGQFMPVPCYFPSISSIKANLKPLSYLEVLFAVDHPLFLISAYDIFHSNHEDKERTNFLLEKAINNGKTVLLDSGNYESYWNRDNSWSIDKYRDILKTSSHTTAFAYDFQNPSETSETIISIIIKQVIEDIEHSPNGLIVPIVHGNKENVAKIIFDVAKEIDPIMIAVPERILGNGIIERAKTVLQIRQKLNDNDRYYPLHLLGTGNPLSILLYVICGADSFDGLEWSQTTVDHKTGLLYHFQQRELFGKQSPYCTLEDFPYHQATFGHNLLFYRTLMDNAQICSKNGSFLDLANNYFTKEFLSNFEDNLIW